MNSNIQLKHLKMFINFASKKLNLSSLPHIHFVGSTENNKNAFGHFKGNNLYVRITDRHPIDIMRTICHELIHHRQKINGIRKSEQFKEDEANKLAGRIMREFDTTYPHVFKDPAVKANMMEEMASAIAANAMGDSSPSNPDSKIAMPEKLLNNKKILKRKPPIKEEKTLLQQRVEDMHKKNGVRGRQPSPTKQTFGNGNTSARSGNDLLKAYDSLSADNTSVETESGIKNTKRPLRSIIGRQ